MKELLWLIVALPFAGSLILVVAGNRLSRFTYACIGVGSVSLAAILTIFVGVDFLKGNPAGTPYIASLWQWINVAGLSPDIAFHLDTPLAVSSLPAPRRAPPQVRLQGE